MGWFDDKEAYESWLGDLRLAGQQIDLSRLDGKAVLVTGANGLIGSCVADMLLCLARDAEINLRVLLGARRPESLCERFSYWDGAYEPVNYDALLPELPGGALALVFHCASNAHPKAYAEQPVETAMANVLGTSNLLAKLAREGNGRMVYVSSSEVYGHRASAEPYCEDDCFPVSSLDSRSCYPVSKRLAENLCASYASEYGVDSVIVRPGHIYGPTQTKSDDRAHAQFAREAAAHRPVIMKSAGAQFRSYCYVADCASAMVFAALDGLAGEAYNIANSESNCTIAELAASFADAGGVPLLRAEATAKEMRGYSRMDNSALDSSKLKALGWKGYFSLEKGTRQTVELLRRPSGGSEKRAD